MAAMRGGSVKKIRSREDSDDESSTDDDKDSSVNSDSDSDWLFLFFCSVSIAALSIAFFFILILPVCAPQACETGMTDTRCIVFFSVSLFFQQEAILANE